MNKAYLDKAKQQSGKFKVHERLNPLHPAPDVTQAELRAEWGNPEDFKDDLSEADLKRFAQKPSRKRPGEWA